MNDLFRFEDGRFLADSSDVADIFRKRHDHILRFIRQFKSEAAEASDWFVPKRVAVTTGGGGCRYVEAFDVTSRGFWAIAMSFTGRMGLDLRVAWVDSFLELEAALDARDPEKWSGRDKLITEFAVKCTEAFESSRNSPCYVYVFSSAAGLCKVGFSSNTVQRVKQVQSDSKLELEVYFKLRLKNSAAARRLERQAHLALSSYNVEGEWFSCPADEAVRQIKRLVACAA